MRWRCASRVSTIHATGHDSGAAQIQQGDDPTIISQRPRQSDGQAFWSTGDGAEGQAYGGCYIGAFERPHLVPSGNRRDPYDDPFDIASNSVELGIHGARFL